MQKIMLDAIEEQLKRGRPRKIPGRRWMVRSSVSVLLTDKENPSLILMRRPEKPGDPWSGDMCFPGGRKAPGDHHTFATAIRETNEEVGLDLNRQGQYWGRLSDVITRAHEAPKPMVVTPFVFLIPPDQQLNLSDEAREIISVPLAWLAQPENREQMTWRPGPLKFKVPCYHYQGARIWGLTLMMIDDLLKLTKE